jgi:hypothetical protein
MQGRGRRAGRQFKHRISTFNRFAVLPKSTLEKAGLQGPTEQQRSLWTEIPCHSPHHTPHCTEAAELLTQPSLTPSVWHSRSIPLRPRNDSKVECRYSHQPIPCIMPLDQGASVLKVKRAGIKQSPPTTARPPKHKTHIPLAWGHQARPHAHKPTPKTLGLL